MSVVLLEAVDRLLLESGDGLALEIDDPPTAGAPDYWRGAAWIGHPKVNWPTDGALR